MDSTSSCQLQLKQLQNDFEEFAYIVSHDLKAPVRAISNLTAWIEEDLGADVTPDVQHNMNLLRNRAERMERMIEALLTYSRVPRLNLEVVPTDTQELLLEIVKGMAGKVTLQLPQPLPVFATYRQKLHQVFYQMLHNASLFSQKETVDVTVQVEEQENWYVFSVQDNGPGFSDGSHDKIFKMFYTAAPKDTLDTVGAGLAIAQKTVSFVGGTITAENTTGQGALLRFSWPKHIASINI